MRFRQSITLLAAAAAVWSPLPAEDTSLELILDCSASMWNKLEDGRYRIDGAKQVLSEFLTTTEARDDLHIGLRLYGSKVPFSQPGACEDTALVSPIEGFARQQMLTQVKEARAVGATPLAKSLELAKDDFTRPGQRRLIVFTDGEESCDGDVQAAMAALQAAGVDVDVKVIGIGLPDEAAKRFEGMGIPVDNVNSAKKLAAALTKAAKLEPAPETEKAKPEPLQKQDITVKLVKSGAPATGLQPEMKHSLEGGAIQLTPGDEGTFTGLAEPGVYTVKVGSRVFENQIIHRSEKSEIVIDLTEAPTVKLIVAKEGASLGIPIAVQFSGAAGAEGDFITIVPRDAPDSAEPFWAYTREEKEGEVRITAFGEPGLYEARFLTRIAGQYTVAGRSEPFPLKEPEITLEVEKAIPAASTMTVKWTGPAQPADWIGWVPVGAPDGEYRGYDRPEPDGEPVSFLAPPEAGEYELRYCNDHGNQVLARKRFTVVASELSLSAPDSAMAGSAVEVGWLAPNGPGIYVTIVEKSEPDTAYVDFAYTANNLPPALIQAPREAGEAEIRIISEQDGKVLHRRPLTLTEMKITLDAPDTAEASSTVKVKWTGPAGKDDFITITQADAGEAHFTDYFSLTAGEPEGDLRMPTEAGAYEIRYVAGNKVRAKRPVTVK